MQYITEENIINNTNVLIFLMSFSEFYLVYQYASSGKCVIIMVERNLSNKAENSEKTLEKFLIQIQKVNETITNVDNYDNLENTQFPY